MDSPLKPYLYLVGLTAFLFFFALGSRDFWAPVEPRYAEIARMMFLKDEWILPTINGHLYTDKPILYFWLVLIGAKIFGTVNEWTVRLPAALGGVGFVLATYLLGRDFLNRRAGLIGAVVLATSMRVLWEARWAHVDTVFCAFFAFAIYFGARTLFGKGTSRELFSAYVFIALATLTKGLIGVVLPGLIFAGYMLVCRDWSMLARIKLHWGFAIFLLVAVPWFYMVTQATDGKWLTDFIYVHHIQRYTAGAGHRQPFYYYLTTLPADLLPWTILIVPALFAYRPLRSSFADPVVQFFLVWFFAVFLFFSLSDTKRDLYLLPLFPTVALFLGSYLDALALGKIAQTLLYRSLTIAFFGLVAVAGICLPMGALFYYQQSATIVFAASAPLFIGGIAVVLYVWRCRPLKVFVATASMMGFSVICAGIWVMPYLEAFKSPRWFSDEVKRIVPPAAPIYIYADTMNDFNYYAGREIVAVLPGVTALDRLLQSARSGYLIIKERDLKRLPQLPARWIVASEPKTSPVWHLLDLRTRAGS